MADWSLPTNSSLYQTGILQVLKARDVDAMTLFSTVGTNIPTNSIRYLRASDKFQEWDGAAWADKVLAIAGGGTGGATAGAARTALGLGTMAVQDSTAVAISGGTIAGTGTGLTALNATNLGSGTVSTARLGSGVASSSSFLRGDSSWQAITFDLAYAADQSADFTAAVNTFYNLSGSHTVTLPTVVGNGGKIIGLVMKGTGTWVIDLDGSELILGAGTYSFDWGQYGVIILKADANGGKWDII
jgi:hypothetical protein